MKKLLLLALATFSASTFAANYEVKMLDNGKDGGMVFELKNAAKEVEKIEKRTTEHKGRLFEYLEQVK